MITFDFIWNCWKNNSYPENFDELLEKYLEHKQKIFENVRIDKPTAWVKKVIIAIEIGMLRNNGRFLYWKKYWETLLGRRWEVSIEDRWVKWID